MKTIILTAACSVTIFGVQAQGIQFESGNWSGVLAKAKKEHRLVYVDAYTTWCGPCKMLATNIFPTKEAGEYYNAHFVNYRVDAEKGEGIDIAKQYAVTGYPTHLYIDPQTSAVVYRGMGYSPEVKDFIKEGQVAELEWNELTITAREGLKVSALAAIIAVAASLGSIEDYFGV